MSKLPKQCSKISLWMETEYSFWGNSFCNNFALKFHVCSLDLSPLIGIFVFSVSDEDWEAFLEKLRPGLAWLSSEEKASKERVINTEKITGKEGFEPYSDIPDPDKDWKKMILFYHRKTWNEGITKPKACTVRKSRGNSNFFFQREILPGIGQTNRAFIDDGMDV